MHEAAVGFQCPSCVSEGAKQTRQGRTTYGGKRSGNPAATSLALIGLNVAVWVAVVATGGGSSRLIALLGLRPDSVCQIGQAYTPALLWGDCSAQGGTFLPGVADGAYWQLVTSMFLHVQIWHVAVNMLALYVLGPQIEAVLGRVRFLSLYLVSGLAGSALVYWAAGQFQVTLGASGAIYGVFGALGVIVLKVGGDLRGVAALLVINILITVSVPNISWQGHLGGFLGGAAVTALLVYAPRGRRRATVQWVGIGAVVAAVVVAVALRSAVLA